jgi:THO complex subunit 2
LTEYLAAVGDLKSVRIMLDRIPQLSQMYPEISDGICRLLHIVLENVETSLRPLSAYKSTACPSSSEFRPPIPSYSTKLNPNTDRVYHGKKFYYPQFKFFYDRYKDQVPQPTSIAGAIKVLRSLLPCVGPHLYRDVLLVGKLIRIGKHHISTSPHDESAKSFWLALTAQFLFPAVSQLPTNPGIANELWSFIKLWPYSTRYALYGEWKHHTYESIPELAIVAAGCRKDIQYIMNRLSKGTLVPTHLDNIKIYGRHIAKIVHSNPTIAFTYVLNSIESYDNMIPFVVEATRYLTDLEFDILCFCLIEALARSSKVRVERNGTSIEKWLKSLSTFCGTLFAKHKIELEGILQYLMNQFLSDQMYDLIVFQELVSSMSGRIPSEDMTSAQLDGVSGGPILRQESLVVDANSVKKAAPRLVAGLISTDLILYFAIAIAQQRKEISFRVGNDEEPGMGPGLKVLAWLNDSCQRAFLQYVDFLADCVSLDQYSTFCPSLGVLVEDYGLDLASSFHLVRPLLSGLVKKMDSAVINVDEAPEPLKELFRYITTSKLHGPLSPLFFGTFWQLDISDLVVPHSRYESEIKKKEAAIQLIDKERSEKGSSSRRKAEKEKFLSSIQNLKKEWDVQKEAYKITMARIEAEKDQWFSLNATTTDEFMQALLQLCIIPRCLMSPADAHYCSKMVGLFHSLGCFNFSTFSFYDLILQSGFIQALTFSFTEAEAKNFGLFLCDCMKYLAGWHTSEDFYNQDAISTTKPGFILDQAKGSTTDEAEMPILLNYQDYRTKLYNWHLNLQKSFSSCLASGEYMQLRNGMIVLDKISEFFPLIDGMGKEFEQAAQLIERTEERNDVKQMARSYYAKLRHRREQWMPPSKFYNAPDPDPIVVDETQEEVVGQESGQIFEASGEIVESYVMDTDISQSLLVDIEVTVEQPEESFSQQLGSVSVVDSSFVIGEVQRIVEITGGVTNAEPISKPITPKKQPEDDSKSSISRREDRRMDDRDIRNRSERDIKRDDRDVLTMDDRGNAKDRDTRIERTDSRQDSRNDRSNIRNDRNRSERPERVESRNDRGDTRNDRKDTRYDTKNDRDGPDRRNDRTEEPKSDRQDRQREDRSDSKGRSGDDGTVTRGRSRDDRYDSKRPQRDSPQKPASRIVEVVNKATESRVARATIEPPPKTDEKINPSEEKTRMIIEKMKKLQQESSSKFFVDGERTGGGVSKVDERAKTDHSNFQKYQRPKPQPQIEAEKPVSSIEGKATGEEIKPIETVRIPEVPVSVESTPLTVDQKLVPDDKNANERRGDDRRNVQKDFRPSQRGGHQRPYNDQRDFGNRGNDRGDRRLNDNRDTHRGRGDSRKGWQNDRSNRGSSVRICIVDILGWSEAPF